MLYYNYHAQAKKRIREGKLLDYYYTADYRGIRPALVLVFCDRVMPIRKNRWAEYASILVNREKM